MSDERGPDAGPGSATRNRVGPAGFVVGMGLVSALTDVVYEGTRAVIGPYLVLLGASAGTVGLVTGGGEALALVLRLLTGPVADRTRRPWPQVALGYGLTALCVPLLALTGAVWPAAALYLGERLGKAVRTPARDVMLAHAAAAVGRGRAFGLHKLLDQTGAVVGPLLVAAALLAHPDGYRSGFLLLGIGGVLSLLALVRLRRLASRPAEWEPDADVAESKKLRLGSGLGSRFLRYQCFSGLTMLGFATWAVLVVQATAHVGLAPAAVPLLYAVAMGAGGLAAVVTGRVYDRRGLTHPRRRPGARRRGRRAHARAVAPAGRRGFRAVGRRRRRPGLDAARGRRRPRARRPARGGVRRLRDGAGRCLVGGVGRRRPAGGAVDGGDGRVRRRCFGAGASPADATTSAAMASVLVASRPRRDSWRLILAPTRTSRTASDGLEPEPH